MLFLRVHDKSFKRWMAHINLLYPFIDDGNEGADFTEASQKIQEGIRHIEPFEVAFSKDSFGYFRHGKSCTLWLKPLVKGMAVEEEPKVPKSGIIMVVCNATWRLMAQV